MTSITQPGWVPLENPLPDAPGEPPSTAERIPRVGLVLRLRSALFARGAAFGVGALAAVLYLVNLTASGYANAYYAAAALAASQSWTAWFFGSLDAGNFITVDKPPLATMVLGLSVRLFGLTSWSILLPEAILGVASVLTLFAIVRRQFGTVAATIAGVAMALTPVAVLMFRYDHPDALMTFLMILAAYGAQRAIEAGRHRWLVLAGIAVGLAFLTKYLQGFLVGPAIVLAYAIAANASVRRRIAGLVVFGAATLATAGAWVAAVELTPASLRPYIGGSTDNSALDLIFGYDGLGRIFGATSGSPQGGANFSGTPGIVRLFNAEFGGQIAWLLPFAAIALVVGLVVTLRAPRTHLGRAGYLLWGGWLVVHAVVFSFMSGIVHSYYAVAMAPAIGALVGAGVVMMWRLRDRWPLGGLPLAAATLLSVGLAALLLARTPSFVPWLTPLIVAFGIAAALLIATPLPSRKIGLLACGLALAAMLAAPTAYSLHTVATPYTGSLVAAGPTVTVADALSGAGTGLGGPGSGGGTRGTPPSGAAGPNLGAGGFPPGGSAGRLPGGPFPVGAFPGAGTDGGAGAPIGAGSPMALGGPGGAGGASDSAIAAYLVANRGTSTWVVAVATSMQAAELELATGAPVMAMGGWSGSDPAITLAQLKAHVAAGTLRYVIVSGQGGGPQGGSSEITSWVVANGTPVTVSGSSATLYDLSGAAAS